MKLIEYLKKTAILLHPTGSSGQKTAYLPSSNIIYDKGACLHAPLHLFANANQPGRFNIYLYYYYFAGAGGNIPFRFAWTIKSTLPALLNLHISCRLTVSTFPFMSV